MAKESEVCRKCKSEPREVKGKKHYSFCHDCRQKDIIKRLAGRKVYRTLKDSDGVLVEYNDGGWRAGYLMCIRRGAGYSGGASIQPIGSRDGIKPQEIVVPLEDVKAVNPELLARTKMPKVTDFYPKLVRPVLVATGNAMAENALATHVAKLIAEGRSVVQVHDELMVGPPTNPDSEPEGPVDTSFNPPFVQDVKTSTEREPSKRVNGKYPPFDSAEAVRLYLLVLAGSMKMKDVIEAVRNGRATGATGNLVRDAARKAGVYEEKGH